VHSALPPRSLPRLGNPEPSQRCHPEAAPRAAEGSAVAFLRLIFSCAPARESSGLPTNQTTTRKNGLDARIGLISLVEANYSLGRFQNCHIMSPRRIACGLAWNGVGDQAS